MKKTFYSFTLIIALIGIAKFFSFSSNELGDDQSFMNHFNSKYSIFALPKPTAQMDFCGERVPLENPDIWERFDKELLKTEKSNLDFYGYGIKSFILSRNKLSIF